MQEVEEQAEESCKVDEMMTNGEDSTLTRNNSCSGTSIGRMSPVKSLGGDSGKIKMGDLAEKEKILNECKVQIKVSNYIYF